jgi:alpha-D-xyloside xylohydrolase
MVNAWYIRNPPWKQIKREENNADRFSPGWESLQARCRETIATRMRLVPYLQGAFATYQERGLPPFRALLMDYPDQPLLADVDDEFMMGDRIVVAPMFAGEEQRKIVLPQGDWCDLWTGAAVAGGRAFSVPRSHEQIPAFIKAGSVLPWGAVAPHAGAPEAREMRVRVYGSGSLPWTSPKSVGGLKISWDQATKKGAVAGDSESYRVTGWDRIA